MTVTAAYDWIRGAGDVAELEDDTEEVCAYPTVVWLDPGSTTGWCVMQVHPHALSHPDVSVLENVSYWEQGEFAGAENDVITACVELAEAWPEAALGVEDFILRRFGMDRAGLSPVRITAAYEWAMSRVAGNARQVLRQSPEQAKTTATDDRLRGWGYYRTEGGYVHARDATRHALTWLRRASALDRRGARLRAAAWPYHYNAAGIYLPDADDVTALEGA